MLSINVTKAKTFLCAQQSGLKLSRLPLVRLGNFRGPSSNSYLQIREREGDSQVNSDASGRNCGVHSAYWDSSGTPSSGIRSGVYPLTETAQFASVRTTMTPGSSRLR